MANRTDKIIDWTQCFHYGGNEYIIMLSNFVLRIYGRYVFNALLLIVFYSYSIDSDIIESWELRADLLIENWVKNIENRRLSCAL